MDSLSDSTAIGDNIFEHFCKLKDSDAVGATGTITQLDVRLDQVEHFHGLVFDVDGSRFREAFRPHLVKYILKCLPEAEVRQTGEHNFHVIAHFTTGISVAQAKKIHFDISHMVLADPAAKLLTKGRVVGSRKRKSGTEFLVRQVTKGSRISADQLVTDISVLQGQEYGWELRQFQAVVEVLPCATNEPLVTRRSSTDRGVCPIHGSGKNRTQCEFRWEEAKCVCYGDCASGAGTGKVWTRRDIIKQRVVAADSNLGHLNDNSSRPRVVLSNRPQAVINRDLMQAAAKSGRLYSHRGGVGVVHDDRFHTIAPSDFSQALSDELDVVRAKAKGGADFCVLPRPIGVFLYNSPQMRAMLPAIDVITSTPCFDAQLKLISKHGYHPESNIYYTGPAVEPGNTTHHLDRLLDVFNWQRRCDRATLIAFLVDRLFVDRFNGKRPGCAVRSNTIGAGKSTLVRSFTAAIDPDGGGDLDFTHCDEELQKRVATLLDRGARILNLDNVRSHNGRRIESPSLERYLTSARYMFRRLGSNTEICGPNDGLLFLTLNSGEFGPDLMSRLLTVRLRVDGDPKARHLPADMPCPIAYARTHHYQIASELVGMVMRWIAVRCPMASSGLTRFPEWESTIGGILQVNRVEGFLEGHAEDQRCDTEDDEHLQSLAELCADEWRSASSWASLAEGTSAWASVLGGSGSDRGKAQKVGRRLTESSGRLVSIGDPDTNEVHVYQLQHQLDTHSKANVYRFATQTAGGASSSAAPRPEQDAGFAGCRGEANSTKSRTVTSSGDGTCDSLRDLRDLSETDNKNSNEPTLSPPPSGAGSRPQTPANPAEPRKDSEDSDITCGIVAESNSGLIPQIPHTSISPEQCLSELQSHVRKQAKEVGHDE